MIYLGYFESFKNRDCERRLLANLSSRKVTCILYLDAIIIEYSSFDSSMT